MKRESAMENTQSTTNLETPSELIAPSKARNVLNNYKQEYPKGCGVLDDGWCRDEIIAKITSRNLGVPSKVAADQSTAINPCVYFNGDGNHCGVGIFIPEKFKDMILANHNQAAYSDLPNEVKEAMPFDDDTMYVMQAIHDDCRFNEDPRPLLIEFVNHILGVPA